MVTVCMIYVNGDFNTIFVLFFYSRQASNKMIPKMEKEPSDVINDLTVHMTIFRLIRHDATFGDWTTGCFKLITHSVSLL